jgi:hypothetical protein
LIEANATNEKREADEPRRVVGICLDVRRAALWIAAPGELAARCGLRVRRSGEKKDRQERQGRGE